LVHFHHGLRGKVRHTSVTVNLATGNAVVSVATPSMPTVGGGIGVSLAYNPQAMSNRGLNAEYFNDDNFNALFDELSLLQRVDPSPYFGYGFVRICNECN
jgi:hypothetical protein